MLSQAVLIAAVIDLIGVNIKGGVIWSHWLTVPYLTVILLLFCFSDGDCQAAQRNFSSNYAFPVTRGEFSMLRFYSFVLM